MSVRNNLNPQGLRQLRKSRGPIAGVCGGISSYFGIEPIIVRILFAISLFVSFGTSFFVYIVLAIFLPKSNREHRRQLQQENGLFDSSEQETASCRKCGEKNSRNRNFCSECGESLF